MTSPIEKLSIKKSTGTQMDRHLENFRNAEEFSDKTKNTYLAYLTMLQKELERHGHGLVDIEWIACHPKEVIKLIFNLYPNIHTRHNMVTMVRTLFRHSGDLKDKKPECFEAWGEIVSKLALKKKEHALSGQMTDKEEKNWVEWKAVLAKEKHLAESQYGSFDHLMLAMYCLIPPLRQNFGNVKIYHATPSDPTKENFIVITPAGKGTLVLNEYKTSKRYGKFAKELPSNLIQVIQASLAANPRDYLFVKHDGEPYTLQNSFTVTSNRTFKRLFGKNVTVSILRHSCISDTDFNSATPQEIFDKAKSMTHSVAMQQMYRKRTPAAPQRDIIVEQDPETPLPLPSPKKKHRRDTVEEGERVLWIKL
jgi:hypothetical protein